MYMHLKERYYHIYLNICAYANILPMPHEGVVRYFYPLTCANCISFKNDEIILILPSRMTKYSISSYYIIGFCSETCLIDYKNVYKNDMNTTGNYIKLIKHERLKYTYPFMDLFSKDQINKLICNPLMSLRQLWKYSLDDNWKLCACMRHKNIYVDWKYYGDHLMYDLDKFENDMTPYIPKKRVDSDLEDTNRLNRYNYLKFY